MAEVEEKLINAIKHYQESLERHTKTGNTDKLLHGIEKLGRLPIKVCHLEQTGVGRTVNGLKRFEGSVGESARNLVDKWKQVVKGEEEEELRLQEQETAEPEMAIAENSDSDSSSKKVKKSSEKRRSRSKDRKNSSKSSHRNSSSDSSSSSDDIDSDSKQKKKKKSSRRSESSSESSDSSSDRNQRHKSSSKDKKKHKERDRSPEKKTKREESPAKQHSKDKKKREESPERNEVKDKKRKDNDKHQTKHKKYRDKTPEKHQSKEKKTSEETPEKHQLKDKKKREESSERHHTKEKKKSEDTPEKQHSKEKKRKRDNSPEKPKKDKKSEDSPDVQTKKHKSDKDRNEKEKRKSEKSSSKSLDSKPPSSSKSHHRTSSPSTSKKGVPKEKLLNGIDSESGASFADALNMFAAPVVKSSKKRVSAPESVEKPASKPVKEKASARSSSVSYQEPRSVDSDEDEGSSEVPDLLRQTPGNLEPLDINLASLLPSITPNYRPLNTPLLESQNRKIWTDDEALSNVISAKHQRVKVYSGNKRGITAVPTLFDICSRVLQDNLDALEYTGGVPYSILKPILEKANPDQLYQLEFHNPYLIEDSDELWHLHCQKEFRNKKREELESWRDMYMRCLDEREAKLKALTANIKHSQDTSMPVRQTKLAYVDSFVKPPRNIARKQAKNGIAMAVMKKPSQTPSERLSQLAKAGEAGKTAVPNPVRAVSERPAYTPSNLKPKKAPLMAKTLSLLKNRFGRR